MARDFKLSMSLNLKDNASKLLASLLKEGTKQASEAEKAAKRQSEQQQKTTKAAISLERTRAAELRRNAKARETLGVSSEQSVQREIDRTIAAYNRLTRAGTMSANEQSRAYNQMRGRVAALRKEMQGVTRLERARQTGNNVMTIAGGVMAAGAAVVQPIRKQMSYSERLTEMTNTAFSGEGMAGRTAGMQRLDKLIRQSVQSSGLNKEGVMDAANALFASGLKEDAVSKMLPTISRYASASKANPVELAQVAIKARGNFGISDEQIPTALNMAIAAGQAGNFELADMAKWLGPQMAAAHGAGMSGLNDLKKLLTLNELSSLTAGSNDEAGNNVVNLLGKLTSVDTARAAARVKVNGKGIDLPNTMAGAREKGLDQIEALSRVIDTVVEKDKNYRKLQARLQALGKDDKDGMRETLTAMSTILEGSGVGKIIADRQALMAIIAYRNGKGYKAEIDSDISAQQHLKPGEQSAGDLNFEFNAQQDWFKVDQAKNAMDYAQMDAVKPLAHLTGTFAGGMADATAKFPGLATAVARATTAIQAMTQAALAMAGLKFLTGGAGALTGATSATTAAVATAAKGGSLLGTVGTLGGAAGVATAFATATSPEEDEAVSGSKERWKAIRAQYPQSLIDAARKRYQPWYQFGEGYSTENERWIQQYLADKAAGKISDAPVNAGQVPSPARDTVTPSQVMSVTDPRRYVSGLGSNQYPAQPQKIELNNKTVLEVDGQTLAEVVNRYNVLDASRGTGAGGNP